MGEETFGPVKARFSSVGKCQGTEVEKVVGRESSFVEASGGRGDGTGEKGDNI